MPHLAEQDDRRPLAAPAHRARLDAAPITALSILARVFVITGPSGVGKGTLIRTLLERVPELELSVSATTRDPRPGEEDGVDYHFLDDAEFDRRVLEGEFVEHADYSGRRYGTLRSELDQRLERGAPVVLEIEVQGARQVRETMPEAVRIFIAPPSEEALRTRLVGARHRRPRAGRARGCASAARRARPPGRVRPRRRQRPPRGRGRRRSRRSSAPSSSVVSLKDAGSKDWTPDLPRVDRLLEHVDSNYASVIVAAKRARQINSYYHNLGEGTFEEFPPPMVDTGSKNYLTIALEEVASGKINYRYR